MYGHNNGKSKERKGKKINSVQIQTKLFHQKIIPGYQKLSWLKVVMNFQIIVEALCQIIF
jgi:hypothetical protein